MTFNCKILPKLAGFFISETHQKFVNSPANKSK